MKARITLALAAAGALLCASAIAQPASHGAHAPAKNPNAGARYPHKKGDYVPGDHAKLHEPPIGTGGGADGGSWLRVDVSGEYVIHNADLISFPGQSKVYLDSARGFYRVLPHRGRLVWTRPDGVQERVPKERLLPAPTIEPLMRGLYERRPELKRHAPPALLTRLKLDRP